MVALRIRQFVQEELGAEIPCFSLIRASHQRRQFAKRLYPSRSCMTERALNSSRIPCFFRCYQGKSQTEMYRDGFGAQSEWQRRGGMFHYGFTTRARFAALSDWTEAGKVLARFSSEVSGRLTNDASIAMSAGRSAITVIAANASDFARLAAFRPFQFQHPSWDVLRGRSESVRQPAEATSTVVSNPRRLTSCAASWDRPAGKCDTLGNHYAATSSVKDAAE